MMKTSRFQSGFTLLELLIVLTVISLVVPYVAPNLILKYDERRSDVVIGETAAIYAAAANFRVLNGAWPGGAACNTAINDLTLNGLLTNVTGTNSFNETVTTSCTLTDFTVVQETDSDVGSYIAAALPATQISNAATGELTSVFPLPGNEPALQDIMDLAGSRVMTGDLQMGGNDIDNASTITATTQVSAPRFVDSNNIAYSIDPSATSTVSRLDADTEIRAPIIRDSNNVSFFVDPSSRSELSTLDVNSIRDSDDTSYTVDPASTSNLADVQSQDLYLSTAETAGAGCTTGSVGRTSTGQLLSCVSGIWQLAGGGITVVRSSLGTNGYVQYSNGLIIQWGLRSSPNTENTLTTVNFPLTFPRAVFNIQTTVNMPSAFSQGASDVFDFNIISRNRSRFLVRLNSQFAGGFRPSRIAWQAIGY